MTAKAIYGFSALAQKPKMCIRDRQIHGGGGADSGYVISLNEIDDVADRIEAFLNGIVYLVMHGTDMTGPVSYTHLFYKMGI